MDTNNLIIHRAMVGLFKIGHETRDLKYLDMYLTHIMDSPTDICKSRSCNQMT